MWGPKEMWGDQVLSPLIKIYFRLRIHYCRYPGCVCVWQLLLFNEEAYNLLVLTLKPDCLDLHLGSPLRSC